MEEEEAEETAFGGGRPLRPPARALTVCPAGGCDAAPPQVAYEGVEFALHARPFGPPVVALLAVRGLFIVLARGAGGGFGSGGRGGVAKGLGAVGGLAVGAGFEVDREARVRDVDLELEAGLRGVGMSVGGLSVGGIGRRVVLVFKRVVGWGRD